MDQVLYARNEVAVMTGAGRRRVLLSFPRRQHLPAQIGIATLSARNDVIAALLKLWGQIENPSSSIDAYSLEEQSCQISSRSNLKRRSLRLFFRGRPNEDKKNKKKNKMSSDMGSVSYPKKTAGQKRKKNDGFSDSGV